MYPNRKKIHIFGFVFKLPRMKHKGLVHEYAKTFGELLNIWQNIDDGHWRKCNKISWIIDCIWQSCCVYCAFAFMFQYTNICKYVSTYVSSPQDSNHIMVATKQNKKKGKIMEIERTRMLYELFYWILKNLLILLILREGSQIQIKGNNLCTCDIHNCICISHIFMYLICIPPIQWHELQGRFICEFPVAILFFC